MVVPVEEDFPDIYIPFYIRAAGMGEWWEFTNRSDFWCCSEGGLGMEEWFIYDLWFLIALLFSEEGNIFQCPMDAELSFYIWDECYDNIAFTFTSSTITDGGGVCVFTGAEYKEMELRICANYETYEPYIWMQSDNGMVFLTDTAFEDEIKIFSSDFSVDTGFGEGFYLAFGIDSNVTVGIQDSIISTTPCSNPTDFDRNLYLKPSHYGRVKFGEYQMTQSPTITGYVEIVDQDGRVLKLAVIDYNEEYQQHYKPV